MADVKDEMVVAVRADTSELQRQVAALRAELEGPLAASAERAGQSIERALSRAIISGKLGFDDLKRIALNAMADIARAAISSGIGAVTGGVGASGGGASSGLGGLTQGLLLSLLGAPGRATGGPVSAGRAYRVGERGPEWFVPTSSGRVEAAANGGGERGGRSIRIQVNVAGDGARDPGRLAQSGRQIARELRRTLASLED